MSEIPNIIAGKYVVEGRLGEGGMAVVLRAHTRGIAGFSRRVVIKRVHPALAQNPEFQKLFIQEAEVGAALHHPNLVSVIDFDRDEQGALFLVMELVDGVDLYRLLDTGALPIPVILHVTAELLRGLSYIHEFPISAAVNGARGLVHRDMSPQNVLLSWEGAVKISDFGIAKIRSSTLATGTITIKGKPRYMSPEQAHGLPSDGRSDLFAVGVMMWEMLCCQPLFSGDSSDAILYQVSHGQIPDVHTIRKDVPKDISRLVRLLLLRDTAQRIPSAGIALAELVACKAYPKDGRDEFIALLAERFPERAPTRQPSHSSQVDANGASQPATLRPATPVLREWRTATTPAHLSAYKRRSWRWLWAILASLVVGGLGAAIATRATQAEGPTTPLAPPTAPTPVPAPTASSPQVTAGSAATTPAHVPTAPPPAAATTPPAAATPPPAAATTSLAATTTSPAAPAITPAHPKDQPPATRPKPVGGRPSDGMRELNLKRK